MLVSGFSKHNTRKRTLKTPIPISQNKKTWKTKRKKCDQTNFRFRNITCNFLPVMHTNENKSQRNFIKYSRETHTCQVSIATIFVYFSFDKRNSIIRIFSFSF